MPDYPIPKLIPVRAINRAELDAAVEGVLLFHQQQIRTAVSEKDKSSDSLNNEVTALEEPIDEFTRHELCEEDRLLNRMKSGEHRVSPHQDEATGSWTLFGYLGAMMDEVDRKNRTLPPAVRATILRKTRMETGRHELETPVLEALKAEKERLELSIVQLEKLERFEQSKVAEARPNPDALAPAKTTDILDSESDKLALNALSFVNALRVYRQESDAFGELINKTEVGLRLTNKGAHLAMVDTSSVRKPAFTLPILLFLENVTKIWVDHVDPELALPERSPEPSSPYLRYLQICLGFIGEDSISAKNLLNLASRYFRPNLVPSIRSSNA